MFWLREKYVRLSVFGHSAGGRPLYAVRIGQGEKRRFVAACHHANEWLTGLCLWSALEHYANEIRRGTLWAVSGFAETELLAVPWVNPDGAALLTGLAAAEEYAAIRTPPEQWKANLRGVDLNLNYPAKWEQAAESKRALGIEGPGPRDWAGDGPFSEPETAALARLIRAFSPGIMVSLHSQGEEIYGNFGSLMPRETKKIARSMETALGYRMVRTPEPADAAGCKDWFIQEFQRPGFTVEMGLGENPLPLSSFAGLAEKTARLLRLLTAGD